MCAKVILDEPELVGFLSSLQETFPTAELRKYDCDVSKIILVYYTVLLYTVYCIIICTK